MPLPNPSMSFSPFAILTAAEMNDLVENIESLADGSGIATGAVTPEKLLSGTGSSWNWQTWSPTLSGLNIGTGGSAGIVARYKQTGKTVEWYLQAILGASGFSVGDIQFSPPVAFSTTHTATRTPYGYGTMFDSSAGASGIYISQVNVLSSNFRAMADDGIGKLAGTGASLPFTWAAGDQIALRGSYEAA